MFLSIFGAAIVQVVRNPDSSAWIVIGLGIGMLILLYAVKKLADKNYKKDK